MVQSVSCMGIHCTYRVPKVTEEAFIDYFQGCLITYPHKNMFSVGCFSAEFAKFLFFHHNCFFLDVMKYIYTGSQNHRMVGVGRDIWGSSSPTPLPKQGYLQQAAQDLIQAGFEYLQRRRLHNLPGQPVQCSVTLRGKKFFLMFSWNFLCVNLCPLPLVLLLGTTEKSLASSSLHPPLRYLEAFLRSLHSLLQAEQAQLPQPLLIGEMLQPPHHLRSPPLDSLE